MYMYMYVYIYVCVYNSSGAFLCLRSVCAQGLSIYRYTDIWIYIYTDIYIWMDVYTYMYLYVSIYIYSRWVCSQTVYNTKGTRAHTHRELI